MSSFAESNLNEIKRGYANLIEIADKIPEDNSPVSQIQFANLTFELQRITRCLINEIGIRLDTDPWEE